jgi:hypothetical protein
MFEPLALNATVFGLISCAGGNVFLMQFQLGILIL